MCEAVVITLSHLASYLATTASAPSISANCFDPISTYLTIHLSLKAHESFFFFSAVQTVWSKVHGVQGVSVFAPGEWSRRIVQSQCHLLFPVKARQAHMYAPWHISAGPVRRFTQSEFLFVASWLHILADQSAQSWHTGVERPRRMRWRQRSRGREPLQCVFIFQLVLTEPQWSTHQVNWCSVRFCRCPAVHCRSIPALVM